MAGLGGPTTAWTRGMGDVTATGRLPVNGARTTDPQGNPIVFRDDAWSPQEEAAPASAGGGSARASSSGGGGTPAPRDYSALDGLISQVQGQDTTVHASKYTPVQAAVKLSPEANAATYGAAKERTGLALQSALRGLHSELSQRGIVGSGIDAERSGDLYSDGLSSLANTDRQMAEEDADRMFGTEKDNVDRQNAAGEWNANAEMRAQEATAAAQRNKLSLLSSLISMRY